MSQSTATLSLAVRISTSIQIMQGGITVTLPFSHSCTMHIPLSQQVNKVPN
jgi:hypothetical protein